MAIYILNEGLFNRFKSKPISQPTTVENIMDKYKFIDKSVVEVMADDILKDLTRICRRYKKVLGDDPEIYDIESDQIVYSIMFRDLDEYLDDEHQYDIESSEYYDTLSKVEAELKRSPTYLKYANEGYDIEIGIGDGDEGCIYVNYNCRLWKEYQKQKKLHRLDPKLKGYFESANIFNSINFI